MKIYFDNNHAPLAGTPAPLMERRAAEWALAAREFGVQLVRFDDDGAIINVSQADRVQLLNWLESQHVCAADLHHEDVACLLGNPPNKIDVFLTTKQLAHEITERLTPEELVKTVMDANWKTLSGGSGHQVTAGMSDSEIRDNVYINDLLEDAAVAELRAAGIDVPDRTVLERVEYNPGYDSSHDAEYGILPNLYDRD